MTSRFETLQKCATQSLVQYDEYNDKTKQKMQYKGFIVDPRNSDVFVTESEVDEYLALVEKNVNLSQLIGG